MNRDPQQAIEQHFRDGGTLTVLEALQQYHTSELRRVVSRLRPVFWKEGFDIDGKYESFEGARYKRYSRVKMYALQTA